MWLSYFSFFKRCKLWIILHYDFNKNDNMGNLNTQVDLILGVSYG